MILLEFLKLQLLSTQLAWLTTEDKKKIGDMALISALFYAPSFLQSAVGLMSVGLDLQSISHFRQLRQYMPQVAEAVLSLWNRHLDFITPQHIITVLLDEDWNNQAREGVAQRLLQLLPNRVNPLPPTRVAYPGPGFASNDNFWPPPPSLPDLDQFVSEESFLIFNILEISDQQLQDWLSSPINEWVLDVNSPHYKAAYHQLHVFVTNSQYTNDSAER